jgi:hypothetical protein
MAKQRRRTRRAANTVPVCLAFFVLAAGFVASVAALAVAAARGTR